MRRFILVLLLSSCSIDPEDCRPQTGCSRDYGVAECPRGTTATYAADDSDHVGEATCVMTITVQASDAGVRD